MTMPATGAPGGEPSFWSRLRGMLPGWVSFAATLFQAVVVVVILAIVVTISHHFGVLPLTQTTDAESNIPPKVPLQTEEYFLKSVGTLPDPTNEWWLARSDHRLIAHAVFNCKEPAKFTSAYMPRQYFSALLLDLDLSGNHVFRTKYEVDEKLAARENDAPPLALSSADQDLLSLSDAIARARLAAAEGANTNFPWVQRLGLTTLTVAAFATLFVTLQGRMKPIEVSDEDKTKIASEGFWSRIRYILFGPGCGFRWVAFMAITLSIAGTSLTGLRQVYDPTRTLTQNTRALLELRQLHQEIMLGVECDKPQKQIIRVQRRSSEWANAIRRIRANIVPDYGAYANLDFGGTAQRSDTSQNPPQPEVPAAATANDSTPAAPTSAATPDAPVVPPAGAPPSTPPAAAPASPAAPPAATPTTPPAPPANNP